MFTFINHLMLLVHLIYFIIFRFNNYYYLLLLLSYFLPSYLFMLLLYDILFLFLLNLTQIIFVNYSYFVDNFKLFSNIFDYSSIPSIHQSKCVFDVINDHGIIFLIFTLICFIKLYSNYLYHFFSSFSFMSSVICYIVLIYFDYIYSLSFSVMYYLNLIILYWLYYH